MGSTILPQYGFYALGVFSLVVGGQHAILEGQGLETIVESVIIWSLSIPVFVTAYGLPNRDISRPGRWQALAYSIGVTIGFMLLAVAVWLTWKISGPVREVSFLISFAGALGAAVGTRSSLYAVESRERLTEAEELSKLLRINQRVLRHNIRNELSIALGLLKNLETAERTEDVSETTRTIRKHLHDLLEATDRTRRIVSIWESDIQQEFDLTSVVETQVRELRDEYPGTTIRTDLPEHCHTRGHPTLSLAIEEAVVNAIEHNSPAVTVTVSITTQDDGTAIIEVADTGSGIPDAEWKPIKLPEETALAHTEGLGLWTIYWTTTKSGGRVEFDDNDPHGAIVRLILPPKPSFPSVFGTQSA